MNYYSHYLGLFFILACISHPTGLFVSKVDKRRSNIVVRLVFAVVLFDSRPLPHPADSATMELIFFFPLSFFLLSVGQVDVRPGGWRTIRSYDSKKGWYSSQAWGYFSDKNEKNVLIYKEIQKGAVAKSYMTNGQRPPHILLNICAFPHKLGSPSSYMTLQPVHFEFPYTYMRKILFSFYQCCHRK